jgi:hypothetical protein
MTESVPSASRLPVTAAVELLQQRLQDAESRVRWASEELAQAQRRLAQAEGEAAEFRQALALLPANLLGAKGPESRSPSSLQIQIVGLQYSGKPSSLAGDRGDVR